MASNEHLVIKGAVSSLCFSFLIVTTKTLNRTFEFFKFVHIWRPRTGCHKAAYGFHLPDDVTDSNR